MMDRSNAHLGYDHINVLQASSERQIYDGMERLILPSNPINAASSISCLAHEANLHTLAYNHSLITDKVHQIQTLINSMLLDSGSRVHDHSGSSMALASMINLIQGIMLTASSMMVTCQKIEEDSRNIDESGQGKACVAVSEDQAGLEVADKVLQMGTFSSSDAIDGYFHIPSKQNIFNLENDEDSHLLHVTSTPRNNEFAGAGAGRLSKSNTISSDVIELDAADLLAKYTHYCQVCGKGFKRDANLRMHMRAHGDEYKSNAALTNPLKKSNTDPNSSSSSVQFMFHDDLQIRKYSCPQEGCRWNKRHAKFQPLKSMICVKNHYKRSHCPKMYVCNRCNHKQFSLLSDLRTHEKHCGDIKWQCSCGTTFSRKDKLMGHVALFLGHTAITNGCTLEQ